MFVNISLNKLLTDLNITSYNSKDLIQITQKIYHPSCYNYYIDWGDWNIEKNKFILQKDWCDLESENIVFSHKYIKPWKYALIFKDNNLDPFKSTDENYWYYKKEIVIR